jgi:hypothetical protein
MQPNGRHKLSAREVHDIYNRCIGADRRAHPTTFQSTLRWHGCRRSFRRAGEGHNAYVDCPTLRTIVLVLLVVCGSPSMRG